MFRNSQSTGQLASSFVSVLLRNIHHFLLWIRLCVCGSVFLAYICFCWIHPIIHVWDRYQRWMTTIHDFNCLILWLPLPLCVWID
jgi:hypothetical protein